MDSILFWAGALVVVSVLAPLVRLVIVAVGAKPIGDAALASQPDTIHLERCENPPWKDETAVLRIVDPLRAQGFEDAGIHEIDEMPGIHVQLLAQPSGGFYAAVYEHPNAGVWVDIATLYTDGTSSSFTNSRPSGLSPRSGHPVVSMPGVPVLDLLTRARRERPKDAYEAVTSGQAVEVFEKAYAESMADRRATGRSRADVMNVATKKAA